MKKIFIFAFILFLLCIPSLNINAEDYTLKSSKTVTGTYAGDAEDAYNYYMINPSKDGFIAIKVNTSDDNPLVMDICNENKVVIASNISIPDEKTVLHKVNKKTVYYLRIKGTPEVTYKISYKMNQINTLSYAKEYSYTFTNASFKNKSDSITLKMKTRVSGNLNFMCKTDNRIVAQYLNSKKDVISGNVLLDKNNLSGIGVDAKKEYYIKLWNQKGTTSGTTTISNMKYQVKSIITSNNSSRNKSYILTGNQYKESLVVAGEKSTYWYKVKLTKKQKLSIYMESRMLQMNGSSLQLDLYNRDGKRITSKSIMIDEKAYATYKSKKYKMNYPVKKITTGEITADTYYIRVESNSKKSSGSFRIKWK